jgi:hypothetical protein
MSYRDDDDALRLRHDDLARELGVLEAKVAEHHRVAAELATVRAHLAERQARRGPVRLANLRVATPCRQRWEDMVGDERVRVCAGCERPVFNLSEMTMEDAEAVLATRGVKPCVRFYRRADGTVMTSDCPAGRRPRRIALAFAAGALGLGGTLAALRFIAEVATPRATTGALATPDELMRAEEELPRATMGDAVVEPSVPEMGVPPPPE